MKSALFARLPCWGGALILLALLAAACGDDSGPSGPQPEVVRVTVVPGSASLEIGGSVTLAAVVEVRGSAGTSVTWSSVSESIATVSQDGLVTAHQAGETAIVATSQSDPTKFAVAILTVVDVSVNPATVTISSIRLAGSETAVDPLAASGALDVTLNIVPGDQTVTRADILVDNQVVVSRIFGASDGGSSVALGDGDPFSATLTFNTAVFDAQTGVPFFTNVDHLITARLTTTGGTGATAIAVLRFANANAITAVVSASGSLGIDNGGRAWRAGDLTVRVLPIIYSPGGLSLESAVVSWAGLQNKTTGSNGLATWARSTPVLSGGSGGYSNNGGLDPVAPVVLQTTLSNGSPGPTGSPINAAQVAIRLDNRPPNPGVVSLLNQSAVNTCCSGGWVGDGYAFSAGHSPQPGDGEGVDGSGLAAAAVTYHAGPAGSTDDQIAATPAMLNSQALNETNFSNAYSLVVRVVDRVGNAALSRLSPSQASPTTTFGVDRVPPTILFNEALGVAAGAINPGSIRFATLPADGRSGFALLPVVHRVFGNFSASVCFLGGSGCSLVPGGTEVTIPAADGFYYTYEATARDQAGNTSTAITRTILLDHFAPEIASMPVPSAFVGGAQTQFAASIADNVDLKSAQHRLDFTGFSGSLSALPFKAEQVLSPFGSPLVATANVAAVIPFVRSLELTNAADAPSGLLQSALGTRYRVLDHAGNVTEQSVLFAGGAVPPGTGAAALLLQQFRLTAPALPVLVCSTPPCIGSVASVTFTATATGPSGTFGNPFPNGVYFYWVDGTGLTRLIGSLAVPTGLADDTTRRWSWSVEFAPTGAPPQANVQIFAIGVDSEGDALRTRVSTNVSIVSALTR